MKALVIFLCIATGHVIGELEGRDSAVENLRAKKAVLKEVSSFVSIDDNKTSATKIESLREIYEESSISDEITTDPEDANSIEMTFSKNPSPVIEISTAEQNSSKKIKNYLETMYVRKRTRNLNVLQNVIKNSRESVRGWNDFLNSVLRYAEALGLKRTDLASDDIRLRRRKRQVDDPDNRIMSYRAYNNLRKKLPLPMRLKIRETQLAEDYLLDYWVGAGKPDEWRLNQYNKTRFEELEEFKKLVDSAGDGRQEIIDTYKAIRKGTPWNYDKLRDKYTNFFSQSSDARTEYEAMKYKEFSWIECFLNGTDVTQLAAAGPKYYAMDEERERRVRAKEAETLSVEVVVDGGSAESIVATTDDVGVEATNTATTTPPAQAKSSSSLVRIAVLFALVTQVILAILILGPEISKLAEWCERRKTEDDIIAAEEKEPLYRKNTLQLVAHGKSRSLLSTDW